MLYLSLSIIVYNFERMPCWIFQVLLPHWTSHTCLYEDIIPFESFLALFDKGLVVNFSHSFDPNVCSSALQHIRETLNHDTTFHYLNVIESDVHKFILVSANREIDFNWPLNIAIIVEMNLSQMSDNSVGKLIFHPTSKN